MASSSSSECCHHLLRLPQIIAICGAKRAGKDTAAAYIAERYGYTIVKFAQPLKDAMKILFDMTDEQLESDKKDEVDPFWQVKPRQLMTYLGTDVFQFGIQAHLPNIGRRFWAERLFNDKAWHASTSGAGPRWVISDLRFAHELDVIHRQTQGDYIVLRVLRGDRRPVADGGEDGTHCSEREHHDMKVHAELMNTGSIQFLRDQIDAALCCTPTRGTTPPATTTANPTPDIGKQIGV